MSLVISLVPEVKADKWVDGDGYGYVFSLSSLRKYAGKLSHTWREIDGLGER